MKSPKNINPITINEFWVVVVSIRKDAINPNITLEILLKNAFEEKILESISELVKFL